MLYRGTNADGEPLSSSYVYSEHHETGADCPFSLDCSDLPSLTRQEFAAECDINILMERYEKSGVISHVNQRTPQYLDLGDVPDLQTAHHIIQNATAEFMALPASVRREFDNDPMQFLKFADDPANIDRMRALGLAAPLPEAKPAPASDAPAKPGASDAGAAPAPAS